MAEDEEAAEEVDVKVALVEKKLEGVVVE